MGKAEIIYLDNAATTRVLPCAAQAAVTAMTQEYGNPAALYSLGKNAQNLVENARGEIMAALNAKVGRVVFTSCATESINWAITSGVNRNKHRGNHIVTTKIEHAATLETVKNLVGQGFSATYVDPQRDGSVLLEEIVGAVCQDTILVSIMQVCNETGAVLPIHEVAAAVRKINPNIVIHIDGVQGFTKLDIFAESFDYISLSAHKIGGVKGCGALYVGKNAKPLTQLFGGLQDSGLRSGTVGVPQISAFGEAVGFWRKNRDKIAEIESLRAYLCHRLCEIKGEGRGAIASVIAPLDHAPHIVNVGFDRGRSEVLIRVLSDRGICVAGGSACAGGKKSHVLMAMKCNPKMIDSSLRISLCHTNTKEEIDIFIDELKKALSMF